MSSGVGIFLIVVGAVLTFAVDATVAGLNLDVVGWILMLAGVAGVIFFLYFWHRRRTPREFWWLAGDAAWPIRHARWRVAAGLRVLTTAHRRASAMAYASPAATTPSAVVLGPSYVARRPW